MNDSMLYHLLNTLEGNLCPLGFADTLKAVIVS